MKKILNKIRNFLMDMYDMNKHMKLILFMLASSVTLGQDIYLDHSYINPSGFAVGDTITVKFNTLDNNSSTPSLIQYDFQFNNKLLDLIDYTWKVTGNGTNSTAQTSWNSWTGYTFNPDSTYDDKYLTLQYQSWDAGDVSYTTDADWNVVRITIQDGQAINHGDTLIEVRFVIKNNNGTNYDYSKTTKLNWARAIDNSDGTNYSVDGMTMAVDLGNVSVPTNGGITIKVNVPHTYKTDLGYSIYHNTQIENGSPKQGETAQFSGNFDANGEAILTDLYQDENYFINIYVDQKPTWLDDVITVTDVYKVFKYVSGDNLDGSTNGWEYDIQDILGEVTNDQQVNFDDSYELLAHINGYASSANVTSAANGSFNVSGEISTFGVTGDNMLNHIFKPTANQTTFTFAHGLRGDVDFSHSTEPTATAAKNADYTAKISSAPALYSSARSTEDENLSIVSSLQGDIVELSLNMTKSGLVGTQFKLTFDSNILEFDSVVYDTGNQMTNFMRSNDDTIWIGSLDSDGNQTIKTGTPYKILFKTKQTITNTIGLINYKITEGVKTNGTKVNFNIQ
jgi:hypothetical protein